MKTLVLFLLLSASQLLHAQPQTVITYNIRFDNPADGDDAWPKRRDFLAAQIRFHAPDVFGVQEALYRQLEYLDTTLKSYTWVGGARDDGKQAGEYSALFYQKDRFKALSSGTFWLSETPEKPSKGWDAALNRVCTYALLQDKKTKQKTWVFNTHFDHMGQEARRRSAELIVQKSKELNTDGYPVIVMGDLNANPDEAPIEVMKKAFTDAQEASAEPPFGPTGTFNGFNFHDPVTRRIDYVFVKGLKVRQYAVLSDSKDCHYPSDHLPVLVRFE
jgi:endonuclease/exonuclease/phosphatase family metal-dependent hydrolase